MELKYREHSSKDTIASEPPNTAPPGEEGNVALTNYVPFGSRPIKNLIHIVKASMTDDYVFFQKVSEALLFLP